MHVCRETFLREKKFMQDPDTEPKLPSKSDPELKKIIPDPQNCITDTDRPLALTLTDLAEAESARSQLNAGRLSAVGPLSQSTPAAAEGWPVVSSSQGWAAVSSQGWAAKEQSQLSDWSEEGRG